MIAGNLEYLMASLPHLSFQDTVEERSKVLSLFRKYAGSLEDKEDMAIVLEEEAQRFLGTMDYEIFQKVDLNTIHQETFQKSKNKVLSTFSKYMNALKIDLERLRISRKNAKEPSDLNKQFLPLIQGTPLEEEQQILKWQWNTLEELSIGHYTDFEALCLYKLKLLLLLRWWSFDEKIGFDNFLNLTKKD
ncbi:DUF2764 family protein [Flagellimonas meridianipacifica]|uniref:Uncharacterized protein DUF2764 n=1 Tax=Flagellimonas meridianipacifica TaxID=1080225 RepID=A0A2T0MD51_9FLAO|nr:DUF2764 family protein [Allomuricauda pacifica]PRX55414.1 uncharacterized protein DUF2764 [Allomuricauda pacifica]